MSDDQQRCHGCGARNATDAPWCTQCFAPLGERADAPGPADPAGAAPAAPASASTPPPPPSAPVGPADGPADPDARFRGVAEGAVEWRCAVCDAWHPLEVERCDVCGTLFGQGPTAGDEVRADVATGTLVAASAVLPGAGHALLGLRAQALTRGLLALVWGSGGLWVALRGRATGGSIVPALPLLVGWLVLAAASANDAAVAGGAPGRELLGPRALLWLVVAVVGASFLLVLAQAMSAGGG